MDYLRAVITEYKTKGIVVDTNLLILYIVGFYDINYIDKFSRVKNKGYVAKDFEAIANLIRAFEHVFVTPHILAELSNLSFNDIKDQRFIEYFQEVLKIIGGVKEKYVNKDELLKIPFLAKFGFTDVAILDLAVKEGLPVITDDFKLNQLLIKHSIKSINMDTIRAHLV